MSYTWEDVILGIDVKNEQARKAEQQKTIEKKAADEATAAGAWSLGLSLLGGAIFGPVGYFLGKQAGKWGTDAGWFEDLDRGDYSNWEDLEVEEGKFNVKAAREFNKSLTEAADDQTKGQILSTVLDLGKMYVSAGGLTAEPGELDITTFGSGEGEWSLFGKQGGPTFGDQVSTVTPGPSGAFRPVDVTPVTFESDVPALWSSERGLLDNLGQVATRGQGLIAQDQSVTSLSDYATDYYEYLKGKE